MEDDMMLEAVDLYRFYHTEEEETLALRGISLCVRRGELVALMGPSGSGKSTLLSCVSGIDEPDGGYVRIAGTRITRKREAQRAAIRAAHIGIIMQSGNLFEQLSVYDNMRMRLWIAGTTNKVRFAVLAEEVGIAHRMRAFPAQISGGEAARASLAVALITGPELLLADEPTGEVDAETEERMIALFEKYRREGGSALIATHSEALASRLDRVIHIRDGRIIDER